MKPRGATPQRSRARLEEQIVAVLRQAMANGRLDVADHLLSALEVLASDCTPGSSLNRAYMPVAEPQDP